VRKKLDSIIPALSPIDKFKKHIADDMQQVDKIILHAMQNCEQLINEMSEGLIKSGGKRLRPALTILCGKLCGYDGERLIYLASAVELIHTATLLHDDVVDESDLRRGKETAHKIWGNKSPILVGDYLLSQSFQLMVKTGSLRVLDILSNASAIIAEGEVQQLLSKNHMDLAIDRYFTIITAKTAKLFAASCETAAVVSGAKEEIQTQLDEFGNNIGIAFQIVDDALDYQSNNKILGKNKGDDFFEGKVTLPLILAYEKANKIERALLEELITKEKPTKKDFATALELINKYQALEDSFDYAEKYLIKAKDLLADFSDSKEKEILLNICDFCLERRF
jgi:octaprenyl-diphosphate synthase